jgi:hypothetical protein
MPLQIIIDIAWVFANWMYVLSCGQHFHTMLKVLTSDGTLLNFDNKGMNPNRNWKFIMILYYNF